MTEHDLKHYALIPSRLWELAQELAYADSRSPSYDGVVFRFAEAVKQFKPE
jgi:hypothetical protein